jgi:hypothetical protein
MTGGRFDGSDRLVANDRVHQESDQRQRDNPHEEHDELLSLFSKHSMQVCRYCKDGLEAGERDTHFADAIE